MSAVEGQVNSLSCETFGSFSVSPGSSICKGGRNRKTPVNLYLRLTPCNSIILRQETELNKYYNWVQFKTGGFPVKVFLKALFCCLHCQWIYITRYLWWYIIYLTHDLIFSFYCSVTSHLSLKSTRSLSQRLAFRNTNIDKQVTVFIVKTNWDKVLFKLNFLNGVLKVNLSLGGSGSSRCFFFF